MRRARLRRGGDFAVGLPIGGRRISDCGRGRAGGSAHDDSGVETKMALDAHREGGMRLHDFIAAVGAAIVSLGVAVVVMSPAFRWMGAIAALVGLGLLAYGASFL